MNVRALIETSRLSRRQLGSGIAATLGVLALSACGSDDDDAPATAEPTATQEIIPTPTQEVISSPVAGYNDPLRWKGRTLSVATWGGEYQTAQEEAFFKPFMEATGVDIQTKHADIERLKDQVNDESVVWDLISVEMDRVLSLSREGYLTPIDYNIVDNTLLIPEFALQFGVGVAAYSTVMVYGPDLVARPSTWADFWKATPPLADEAVLPEASRALPRTPIGTFEFALIADGVAPADLYPLDIERAFLSLDKIRKNVVVWYEDGKQPIEIVLAKQAAMSAAWNVRAFQFGESDGLGMVWNGGMLAADAWSIPIGAPNTDVAMDFINFASRAVPNANFCRLVPYGPVNRDSLALLRPDRASILPTYPENLAQQFVQNWNWWADNLESVRARFEQWLLASEEDATPATD